MESGAEAFRCHGYSGECGGSKYFLAQPSEKNPTAMAGLSWLQILGPKPKMAVVKTYGSILVVGLGGKKGFGPTPKSGRGLGGDVLLLVLRGSAGESRPLRGHHVPSGGLGGVPGLVVLHVLLRRDPGALLPGAAPRCLFLFEATRLGVSVAKESCKFAGSRVLTHVCQATPSWFLQR